MAHAPPLLARPTGNAILAWNPAAWPGARDPRAALFVTFFYKHLNISATAPTRGIQRGSVKLLSCAPRKRSHIARGRSDTDNRAFWLCSDRFLKSSVPVAGWQQGTVGAGPSCQVSTMLMPQHELCTLRCGMCTAAHEAAQSKVLTQTLTTQPMSETTLRSAQVPATARALPCCHDSRQAARVWCLRACPCAGVTHSCISSGRALGPSPWPCTYFSCSPHIC